MNRTADYEDDDDEDELVGSWRGRVGGIMQMLPTGQGRSDLL